MYRHYWVKLESHSNNPFSALSIALVILDQQHPLKSLQFLADIAVSYITINDH